MAFEEAGKSAQGDEQMIPRGLRMTWSNLVDEKCPNCDDDLTFFEDRLLYKCVCGFKISSRRLEEIGSSVENGAFGSGFSMGNWEDEPPFGSEYF